MLFLKFCKKMCLNKMNRQAASLVMNYEKHALRVSQVTAAVAKYKPTCIWLVARVNKIQGETAMFEMKEEYYLGVDLIDGEHKKLFEIAEEAYKLLNEEFVPDKFDYIVKILEELKDYTIFHFEDEEKYMESIQYKKLFSHKIEHQEFIEKLNQLDWEEIEKNQDKALLEILNFLNDWLVNHILYTDKQYTQQ